MILLLSLNKPVLPSHYHKKEKEDYPGGVVDESSPASAGDMGSILGQGMKIPHATWLGQKIK